MELGGVMLGAGMMLHLHPGDYLYGTQDCLLTLTRVLCVCTEHGSQWVILDGLEQPTAHSPWRHRQVQVRVTALKNALALLP